MERATARTNPSAALGKRQEKTLPQQGFVLVRILTCEEHSRFICGWPVAGHRGAVSPQTIGADGQFCIQGR